MPKKHPSPQKHPSPRDFDALMEALGNSGALKNEGDSVPPEDSGSAKGSGKPKTEIETVRVSRKSVGQALGDTPAVVPNSRRQPPPIPGNKSAPVVRKGAVTQPPPIPTHLTAPKNTSVAADPAEKLSPIDRYHQEYDRLPAAIRARTTDTWENIRKRLTPEKLQHIHDMQGHGQLFGIDTEGRVLFKDGGTHPVMYGYVYGHAKRKHLIQIYDRDDEKKSASQMNRVNEWADGDEILEQVEEKEGYELFKDDGKRIGDSTSHIFGFGDEMKQAEAHTGKPFIACPVHNLKSWVKSGNGKKPILHIVVSYRAGGVQIHDGMGPKASDSKIGVVRMLRV